MLSLCQFFSPFRVRTDLYRTNERENLLEEKERDRQQACYIGSSDEGKERYIFSFSLSFRVIGVLPWLGVFALSLFFFYFLVNKTFYLV